MGIIYSPCWPEDEMVLILEGLVLKIFTLMFSLNHFPIIGKVWDVVCLFFDILLELVLQSDLTWLVLRFVLWVLCVFYVLLDGLLVGFGWRVCIVGVSARYVHLYW